METRYQIVAGPPGELWNMSTRVHKSLDEAEKGLARAKKRWGRAVMLVLRKVDSAYELVDTVEA